jgi:hypothetical protein
VQALFQIKVWIGEADGFNAFLGLRKGRKKMGRESPCPAIWPLVAALGSLSSVAVMDLLQPLADLLQ